MEKLRSRKLGRREMTKKVGNTSAVLARADIYRTLPSIPISKLSMEELPLKEPFEARITITNAVVDQKQ